ncbi:MAG: hypothetical protein ACRDZN_04025 [Acidimicrobiales bacterium]
MCVAAEPGSRAAAGRRSAPLTLALATPREGQQSPKAPAPPGPCPRPTPAPRSLDCSQRRAAPCAGPLARPAPRRLAYPCPRGAVVVAGARDVATPRRPFRPRCPQRPAALPPAPPAGGRRPTAQSERPAPTAADVHSVAMRIGMLAPMPSELRPLVRRLGLRRTTSPVGKNAHEGRLGAVDVVGAMTGMGTIAASEAARQMVDAGRVDHIVVVGIAGGIDDSLAIGDVVVPTTVIDGATGQEYRPHPLGDQPGDGALHTSDEFIVDPDRVEALRARGVVALDMETAAIGAVCRERGCPWSVFRAISDRSSDGLADKAVFHLAHPDGSPNLPAAARLVARQPRRIPDLVRLGRDARTATQAAAAAAVRACGGALGGGARS